MLTGLDFALALCLGVSSNLCFCCTCDANVGCFLCDVRLGESDQQCPCEGDRPGWPVAGAGAPWPGLAGADSRSGAANRM